ncbi:hypothetical protein Ddye_004180 [Dipteronia dyeriana]|uniref:Phytocyanin domain-containing protein n=1 Tax=Dipteronia dyeriana TaxID=168575 RepID=A0AAE0CW26_9ROSI|nr:hypothetical protein Ddye_004180 [Dipteronia dyeriana]
MEDQKIILKYNSYQIIVIIVMINILFLKGIKSEDYIVGGDQDQWNSQRDFGYWSQQYNFSVGDVLVFKYNKEQHNAYEVTHTTYQTCDASSGVLAKYESGNDQITLTEAKKYWFICNAAGHCLGGMRFTIDVKESVNNNSTNTSTSSSGAPSTPPTLLEPNNSCNIIFGLELWHIGIYIVALFGLFFT